MRNARSGENVIRRSGSNEAPLLVAALSFPAPADIARDSGEPLGPSGRIVELVPMAPGLTEGLLGQVFRGLRLAREPRAQTNEHGPFRGRDHVHLVGLI
jgi:hypothetical protein